MTHVVDAPDDYHDECDECGRAYYHEKGCPNDDWGERSGEPVEEDRFYTIEERQEMRDQRRREDFRARRRRLGTWVERGFK